VARPFRLRSPKLKLTENDVERACLDVLAYRGYKVVRHQVGRFKTVDGRWITIGETGMPDYICLHATRPAFLLEVKRPGAVLSSEQLVKIRQLEIGYGLAVALVDGVEALADWLARHEAVAPPERV
jgi:hypothetical protein